MANVSSITTSNGGFEPAVTVTTGFTTNALAAASVAGPVTAGVTPGITQLQGILPGAVNYLTTVAATSGMNLPVTAQAGVLFVVVNTSVTPTTIYPPVGGFITSAGATLAVNTGVALAAAGTQMYVSCGVRSATAPATSAPAGTEFVRVV